MDDEMKKIMDLIHEGIGKSIFEKIDEGQIGTSDEEVLDFMVTCMSNKASARYIGWLVADEFDLDREEVSNFLENIYQAGFESLRGGSCE